MEEGTKTMELNEDRRRLLQNAVEHWAKAVKGIRTRLSGMGYWSRTIERDYVLLAGTDGEPGLVDRLDPQAGLFEDVEAEGAAIDLSGDEQRLAYFALKKHREKIQKLRKQNREEGYDTSEQERDLGILGEAEESTGMIGEVDRGWEDEEADPTQMEMEAA